MEIKLQDLPIYSSAYCIQCGKKLKKEEYGLRPFVESDTYYQWRYIPDIHDSPPSEEDTWNVFFLRLLKFSGKFTCCKKCFKGEYRDDPFEKMFNATKKWRGSIHASKI